MLALMIARLVGFVFAASTKKLAPIMTACIYMAVASQRQEGYDILLSPALFSVRKTEIAVLRCSQCNQLESSMNP